MTSLNDLRTVANWLQWYVNRPVVKDETATDAEWNEDLRAELACAFSSSENLKRMAECICSEFHPENYPQHTQLITPLP